LQALGTTLGKENLGFQLFTTRVQPPEDHFLLGICNRIGACDSIFLVQFLVDRSHMDTRVMFFTRLYEDKQLQKYWNCSTLLLLFRENGCQVGIKVISGPAHHWPVETLGWCCEEVYIFSTLSENFG
jgi:hypothetical protein